MTRAKEIMTLFEKKLFTVEQISDILLKGGFINKRFYRGSDKAGYVAIEGPATAEVYGKKAFVYVRVNDKKGAENYLDGEGTTPSKKYMVPNVVEVPVQYFKGSHWDE